MILAVVKGRDCIFLDDNTYSGKLEIKVDLRLHCAFMERNIAWCSYNQNNICNNVASRAGVIRRVETLKSQCSLEETTVVIVGYF